MKLKCNICNSEIDNMSILHKDVIYREDVKISNGKIISDGEEYFQDIIKEIIYKCKNCGEIIDKFSDNEKPMTLRNHVQLHLNAVEKNLKIIEE